MELCGGIKIRRADRADLDALSALEASCFPPEEAAGREALRRRIEAYPSHVWVLETPDGIAAMCNGMVTNEPDLRDEMYEAETLHREAGAWQMVFSLAVRPEARGKGYAARLIRQVGQDARAQGRRGVVLTCKEALIPFYARFGFADEGVSVSSHGGAVWHQMRLTF